MTTLRSLIIAALCGAWVLWVHHQETEFTSNQKTRKVKSMSDHWSIDSATDTRAECLSAQSTAQARDMEYTGRTASVESHTDNSFVWKTPRFIEIESYLCLPDSVDPRDKCGPGR